MRIIHATDYEDMSRKAANIIAAQVVMDPACVSRPGHRFHAHWDLSEPHQGLRGRRP